MARFKAKDASDDLINKCAEYLNDNFHKFSQSNKIKISLEIFKRKMPTQIETTGDQPTYIFTNITNTTSGRPISEVLGELNSRLSAQFIRK